MKKTLSIWLDEVNEPKKEKCNMIHLQEVSGMYSHMKKVFHEMKSENMAFQK